MTTNEAVDTTVDDPTDAGPGPTGAECHDPEHHHTTKYPIPVDGCPDPRQDGAAPTTMPTVARLNCQIPSELDSRLREACAERMIGPALLVTKALTKFLDELPPAL